VLLKLFKNILTFIFLPFLWLWIGRLFFAIFIIQDNLPSVNQWFSIGGFALYYDFKSVSLWFTPYFLSLVLYLFFPKPKLKSATKIVYFICLTLMISLIFVSILYYPFIKRFVGNDLFATLGGQNLSNFFTYLIDYWWGILLLILGIVLSYWISTKQLYHTLTTKQSFIAIIICIPLWFLALRGSIKLRPLSSLDAYSELSQQEAILAINPLITYLESLGSPIVDYNEFVSDEVLKSHQKQQWIRSKPIFENQPNICLILLESFGMEVTGNNQVGYESWTPFLDSLASESVYFSRAYANGTRSMDAIPSLFLGVPTLIEKQLITTDFLNGHSLSLLNAVKEKGYHSSFYHGADCESMNFRKFLKSIGLQKYGCKNDVSVQEECISAWGVHDHCFLQHFSQELNENPTPWFATFFSLSSHHPYDVPFVYNDLKGEDASFEKSVRYTDLSLQQFFEYIKNEPWFDETIFIITADHSGKNRHRRYYLSQGMFHVPILIYSPKYFTAEKRHHLVNHTDIYATILQMVGINQTFLSFSPTLFDSTGRKVLNYVGGSYYFTKGDYTLEKREGMFVYLHNDKTDPVHRKNLIKTLPELVKEMGNEMDILIQSYNYRLIHRFWE
jgi:phosphoglycerol transferase MdoB-like AlkP superfamily enzyme